MTKLSFDRAEYELSDLQAAAVAVGPRARARVGEGKKTFDVSLMDAHAPAFASEALSQAYRRRVLALTGEALARSLSGALARGFAAVPPDPLEQLEPQVAEDRTRDRAKLLARAKELS